jgi:hypothetical protein
MLQANFEFRPQFLAATLQFLGQSPTEYRQKLLGRKKPVASFVINGAGEGNRTLVIIQRVEQNSSRLVL